MDKMWKYVEGDRKTSKGSVLTPNYQTPCSVSDSVLIRLKGKESFTVKLFDQIAI